MENQFPNKSDALRMVYLLEQMTATTTGGTALLQSYAISDSDESSSATKYYGFLKADGSWYIMKVTVATGVSAFTYVQGAAGTYAAAWAAKASQTYATFDVAF